ncbi:MAG: tRNA (adenosine(37)-N6)-dimethylallyltransferase MiaA [Treponema sp.]|nr:tRNA (adenosine(37)-N6)-dimethylallyltransferase MiaA [Treponema sp.]
MSDYNCIVVLGPTAVGKTSIGVRIAWEMKGEVVSADSRQTYKGLDIGSGKDLCEYSVDGNPVPYHMIDIASLDEEYNVFHYQQQFYRVFDDIIARGKIPVITGGTGLYLDAVIRNYDLVDVPEDKELRASLEEKSLEELSEMYLELKPDLHTKNDLEERERVIRGIEIYYGTHGKKAEELKKTMYPRPDVRPLIIGTTLERPEIWSNIKKRLEERMEQGMIEEVASLHENGVSWSRLEKLGLEYRYLALYLQGKYESKEKMTEELFIAIRQFAKRQETWFRFMEKNGVQIHWLSKNPSKEERISEALSLIKKYF